MKLLRLNPLLYIDTCESHGETPFIVEQQELDPINQKISFVFFCKACWIEKGLDCAAWKSTVSVKEYNDYFGFNTQPDN